MNETCPFCDISKSTSRKIHSYEYWNLFLQNKEKRQHTRQAAGFLALKRHEPSTLETTDEEWVEVRRVIEDAAARLCKSIGVSYACQEITGFNRGEDAGQTVQHAHIHILPVAEEDPVELKGRAGMGAAFEALHRERLNDGKERHDE